MSTEPVHIISLGAGVQSSTMALMAAHGLITPAVRQRMRRDVRSMNTGGKTMTLDELKSIHAKACDLNMEVDEGAVTSALLDYCAALGIEREVVRLRRGWTLAEHPALAESVSATLADTAARCGMTRTTERDTSPDGIAALDAFARWCALSSDWWGWDLTWLATTHIGAVELGDAGVQKWTEPVFRALASGAWSLYWTDTHLYWVASPVVRWQPGTPPRLHREDGPALETDAGDVYVIDGVTVTEQIVMRPETLTHEEITAEPNAEVRRIMAQRYGVGRYLTESGAVVLDSDMGPCGTSARALLQAATGEKWLVGGDGSTDRVYFMNVDAAARTCREAHESICGFDETRIVSEG